MKESSNRRIGGCAKEESLSFNSVSVWEVIGILIQGIFICEYLEGQVKGFDLQNLDEEMHYPFLANFIGSCKTLFFIEMALIFNSINVLILLRRFHSEAILPMAVLGPRIRSFARLLETDCCLSRSPYPGLLRSRSSGN